VCHFGVLAPVHRRPGFVAVAFCTLAGFDGLAAAVDFVVARFWGGGVSGGWGIVEIG